MKGLAETIDRIMALEFRRDGVLDGVIDPLYRAARDQQAAPLAWTAAGRLREAARSGKPIYIATGHVHPLALPYGETDGPPGAAALARSLVLGTTAPVILLTEPAVRYTLEETCRAAGLMVRDDTNLLPMPRSVAVKEFPIDPKEAAAMAQRIGAHAGAIVTVEKIGRASDGAYCTGQGNDVADHLSKIDFLVEEISKYGGLTIGIGDLGNEIGMGCIGETIHATVPLGSRIATVVPTDILIVAGCSNWGAYGICAALAGQEKNLDLIHTAEMEREMILACCRAGGVDGFSTGPTGEVDGASWQTHAAFVQLLRDIVAISISTRRPERHRFEGVE